VSPSDTFVPQETTAGCKHDLSNNFDRSICARDGWMHTFCDDCGQPLDGDCGNAALLSEPET